MEMMTIQVARADEAHADRVLIHDAVGNVDRIDGLVPYPARRRKEEGTRGIVTIFWRDLGLRSHRISSSCCGGGGWDPTGRRKCRDGGAAGRERTIYTRKFCSHAFFYSRVPVLAPFLIRVLVPFTRTPCQCHGPQETGRYFWHGIYPKKTNTLVKYITFKGCKQKRFSTSL